ncbi:hypothetical protein [Burkholderia sp. Ac-20349]|uniref:hypothetical protein n=1 Tax=Burkholderia sp. Ac-20349 TaxID=2703893 RepID=UPI00197BE642|nr:hypothetical protein [Burkholderia sp. Ac-20349]MBN3842959.1 hypothetical protein [Burkholderia sp. Ac-20349]
MSKSSDGPQEALEGRLDDRCDKKVHKQLTSIDLPLVRRMSLARRHVAVSRFGRVRRRQSAPHAADLSLIGIMRQATLIGPLPNGIPSPEQSDRRRRVRRVAIVYHRRFPICLIALRSSARLPAHDPRNAPRFA